MNPHLSCLACIACLAPSMLAVAPATDAVIPGERPPLSPPASCSAEYTKGMATIARAAQAYREFLMLLSSVDNRVEMYWKKNRLMQLYREVDACTWQLNCLRCPNDTAEAAKLTQALQDSLHVPEADASNLQEIREANAYGILGLCILTEYTRPIGNVLMFADLAPALAAATPEQREDYEARLAVVETMQQLESELRGLTRLNLHERADVLQRLQASLADLPLQDFLTPRARDLPLLTSYLRFREGEACSSLMEQYFLLRHAAFPKDERLPAMFSALQQQYELYEEERASFANEDEHYEILREACFGKLKEDW